MAEAVDHFSYDRIRSLQKLKQEIPDEPVQRICDALEFCEELPVEEAFLNLEDERGYAWVSDFGARIAIDKATPVVWEGERNGFTS